MVDGEQLEFLLNYISVLTKEIFLSLDNSKGTVIILRQVTITHNLDQKLNAAP